MEITTNTTISITINGTAYTFSDPHPVTDLINQLDGATQNLALWNQRAADTQAQIDDLNTQITALCVTPT